MEVDFEYSKELLQRINKHVFGNDAFRQLFSGYEYYPWSFQQYFLFSRIKRFSMEPTEIYEDPDEIEPKRILLVPINILIIVITFFAYIKFLLKRPKILLMCSDFLKHGTTYPQRLSKVYEELCNNKVQCAEMIHTADYKTFFVSIFKRRRIVLYYNVTYFFPSIFYSARIKNAKQVVSKILRSGFFTESEIRFCERLLADAVRNMFYSETRIKFLLFILKTIGITSSISIDDVRYSNELVVASKRAGVASYFYQHSNFDYLYGLDTLPPNEYIFPDFFYVWNEYWKRRIPEISPIYAHYQNRIYVGGRAHAVPRIEPIAPMKSDIADETVKVLIPYEVNLSREQIYPYIEALLSMPAVHVFFLLRGDFEKNIQTQKYLGIGNNKMSENLTIIESPQKEIYLRKADVVAGVYSGFIDESIESCKPIAIFETNYPIFNKLYEDGLASRISINNDILAQLQKVKQTPAQLLFERRERFVGGAGNIQESVAKIISGKNY